MNGGSEAQQPHHTSPTPLRGTQSFVGVFVSVWKRPGLVALEVLWRWCTAVPLLLLLWSSTRSRLPAFGAISTALGDLSVFRPAEAIKAIAQIADTLAPPLLHTVRWWLPLALLVWTCAGALAHIGIFRRQDPALRRNTGPALALCLLRSLALLCTFALWLFGLWASWRFAVVQPVQRGTEPNLILYVALGVAATLLLFLTWSVTAWWWDAARLFALGAGTGPAASLRAAVHAPALRSKLVELNLVMGIVRVALLVLAMVASATPLPFESVESPAFLHLWWTGTALVFLLALDLFQVVRRSAGLYLLRALEPASAREPRS